MAKLAIQLEKLPHVWDTLAESYYVKGMHQEAIEAGRKALALAGKKRTYYENQLNKFSSAAGNLKLKIED
jgi:predicted Zn-dependent protease